MRARVSLWLLRALRLAAGAAALAYLGVYLAVGLLHLRYPFDLEWMEGALVDHVQRVLEGRALYVRPTLDFVPFIYTPLYYYVAAGLAKLVGLGPFPLRLVSFLSSLGVLALVAAFVRRESQSRYAALLAAGLFAATYREAAAFYDLARVDSLCVLLLVAALYVMRFRTGRAAGPSPAPRLLAGALLALAVLTKQVALIAALPLFVVAALADGRRALWLVGATVGLVAAAAAALERQSGGWFLYYTFWIPRGHPLAAEMLHAFWTRDLMAPFAIAVLGSLFALLAMQGERRRFYALSGAGLLVASWSARLHTGGSQNVLMPAFAVLAILAGVGFGEAERLAAQGGEAPPHDPRWRGGAAFPLLAALLQLAVLAYDPRLFLPTTRDAAAGQDLVQRIAAAPGDVLVLAHGHLSTLAGKRPHAHEMAIDDVLRAGGGRPGAALRDDILQALQAQRFALVITDTELFQLEINARYERLGSVFSDRSVFWTVTGFRARPRSMYAPKREE